VTVNYGRVNFVGNLIIGSVFALLPTFLIYVASHRKAESLVFFFPLAIFLSCLVLWAQKRTVEEEPTAFGDATRLASRP
jgi:hypothetical protein